IKSGLIRSAHDISEGGLFVTLCESGFNNNLGFSIATAGGIRKDAFLFGEGQSRVVVSVSLDRVKEFESFMGESAFSKLGVVTASEIAVDGEFWGDIQQWKDSYDTAIEKQLSK